MRFHLIDRIDSWSRWEHLSACKVTSRSEAFWRLGPHGPEMPFGLVTESLCQAGNWLLMLSSDHRRRGALLKAGTVIAHDAVRPGDQLRVKVAISSLREDSAVIEGRVSVGERCVLEATGIICAILDAERLDEPDATARMGARLTGTKGLL